MSYTTQNISEGVDWKPATIKKDRSLYNWPFYPLKGLIWLKNYLLAPIQIFHVSLALFVWFFLTPDLSLMKVFSWDWMLALYFRNVGLLFLVTGTVHFWLYIKKEQGEQFQFDKKGLRKNDPRFWFNDQTRENMFFGLVSGCGIWTLYESFTYWMFANGYVLFPVEWFESPIYIIILFLMIPHIRQHHFYFTHRLTHWKPLYDCAHYLHHKNTNTGPWSGLSMHPIEHLIYLSGIIIHWIIPSHPIHASFHIMHACVAPTWGHCGYEKVFAKNNEIKLNINIYFHYLHHRYFECNYGDPSVPWDKLFGSFFDGSKESKIKMKDRLKNMRI